MIIIVILNQRCGTGYLNVVGGPGRERRVIGRPEMRRRALPVARLPINTLRDRGGGGGSGSGSGGSSGGSGALRPVFPSAAAPVS